MERENISYILIMKGENEVDNDGNVEVGYVGEADSYISFPQNVVPDHIIEGGDWEVRQALYCTDKDEMVHDGFIEDLTD